MIGETFSMALRKVAPTFGYANGERPLHFIAHWRFFRKKSQQWLAAQAQMEPSNLSMLENYKQGWSREGLGLIAEALDVHTGALLMVNPLMPGEAALWEAWNGSSAEARERLGEILPPILKPFRRAS